MANNRKTANSRKHQTVYSEKQFTFVEEYLTPKGSRLMKLATTKAERDLVKSKYQKNRYKITLKAVPVKTITHYK